MKIKVSMLIPFKFKFKSDYWRKFDAGYNASDNDDQTADFCIAETCSNIYKDIIKIIG